MIETVLIVAASLAVGFLGGFVYAVVVAATHETTYYERAGFTDMGQAMLAAASHKATHPEA